MVKKFVSRDEGICIGCNTHSILIPINTTPYSLFYGYDAIPPVEVSLDSQQFLCFSMGPRNIFWQKYNYGSLYFSCKSIWLLLFSTYSQFGSYHQHTNGNWLQDENNIDQLIAIKM